MIEDMTIAELTALINQATAQLRLRREQEQQEEQDRRSQIADAVATLEVLLGPEGATPDVNSIRAVRAFDMLDVANGKTPGTTMGENAGLALSLAYAGLEQLTSTLLNVARVLATD